MARRRRRRGSAKLGAVGLKAHGEQVCAQHFRGRPKEISACQSAVRGLISKMIREKVPICKKWCGCPR